MAHADPLSAQRIAPAFTGHNRSAYCVIGHAPWNDPETGYLAAANVCRSYAEEMVETWEANSDFEFTIKPMDWLDDLDDALPEADNAHDYAFEPYSVGC